MFVYTRVDNVFYGSSHPSLIIDPSDNPNPLKAKQSKTEYRRRHNASMPIK